MGINTRGLGRGRAVTVPIATVNRVVGELLEKGHIARPISSILDKLGASTRTEAVTVGIRRGLILI